MAESTARRMAELALESLSEELAPMRIVRPAAEQKMRGSLQKHGQVTAITVWSRPPSYPVIDGFKRLRAARQIPGMKSLRAEILDGDLAAMKAAMLALNRPGAGVSPLEEAWVIQSLIREEHLTQSQVAALLSRHQSWVSRRLSLVERLIPQATSDVQLGLITPRAASILSIMPRGIQQQLLSTIQGQGLSTRETEELARLLHTSDPVRQEHLLTHPREALAAARAAANTARTDLRLSPAAADLDLQIQKTTFSVRCLTHTLTRMDFSLLSVCDRVLLHPALQTLRRDLQRLGERLAEPLLATPQLGSSEKVFPGPSPGPISKTS